MVTCIIEQLLIRDKNFFAMWLAVTECKLAIKMSNICLKLSDTLQDWFAARNIRDIEALANLAKLVCTK